MMKRSHGLIGAALSCAVMGPLPAEAQTPLNAAPKFREAVDKARTQMTAGDLAGAGMAVSALSPTTPLEKYMAASLAMELAVKRNDIVAQRRAIAAILESGAAPDGQLAHLNHIAGYLCYQTGAINNAVVYLTRARALGEVSPQASLLLVESYVRQRKPDDAARILAETIEGRKKSGEAVPPSWYDRAASLAYARKDWAALSAASSAKLSADTMAVADWRSAIAAYVAGARPEKEAELDLYRLQAAAGAMASERDYQGYATLAAAQGYAAEAKAIIDAGEADGKLTKTDPVAATLKRSLRTRAVTNLAALKTLPGKAGSVASASKAMQNGDDLLANSRYAEAVPYYRAALEKGGVDRDRATTRLGIALARSGDLVGAQAALAQATGQWSQIAAFWSAWVQARRGRLAAAPAITQGGS